MSQSDERTVLMVNPVGVEAGGVQRIMLELFKGLHGRDGFRFIVAVPRIGPYEEAYRELGIPVHAFPISILRRSLDPRVIASTLRLIPENVARLRRIIRDEGVRLVHSQKMNTLVGDLAARAEGVPAVHSLHEVPLFPAALYRLMAAPIPRLADRVVVTCGPSRDLLARRWHQDPRVRRIYNGFDVGQPPEQREELRASLGVGPDELLVLAAGRLAPSKGFEHFLEAARQLAPEHPSSRFRLVGDIIDEEDRGYRDMIRERAAGLGLGEQLVLEGFRKDYRDVIAASDLFVLPSVYDTLPSVVIEAMGLGVPVVATRVGGVPEMVDENLTGLLVEAGDGDALARALADLMNDAPRRKAMAQAARSRAHEVFGIERYVADTRALYEELLAERAALAS